MNTDDAVFESDIAQLELLARGKVRDIYAVDDTHLAIVTTDRLSAFDVIMRQPIPGKGLTLTKISRFWFSLLADIVPNHLTELTLADIIGASAATPALEARTMIVKRLDPLPMEAVVRGYLIGSGWADYQRTGSVCGHVLAPGLSQAQRLPEPLFTPATKASVGDHDENIDFAALEKLIGAARAHEVRDISLAIYARGVAHAAARGIIVADTKFEFGLDAGGTLYLIDEVLTPDSSRFWPADSYATGTSPSSFDKQFLRDYLETLDWDKRAPAPELPQHILSGTAARYAEALSLLTTPRS
ncbi:MAG: phosphoribosylaminoimidazolesuccinocarboxamide synthase [Pseudomonadota bacterium]